MARTKALITPPPNYQLFARAIAHLRELGEWSQREVAKAAGISPSQYGRLERAELLDRPSFDDIMKICRFYNMSPNQAATLMGLWPEQGHSYEVSQDNRVTAILGYLSRMPEQQRNNLLDMMYGVVTAQMKELPAAIELK